MAVFAIKMDASDVKRGAAEAAAAMKDVAKAAEQASSSIGKATGTAKRNYEGLSEAAKAAGMFNDSLGRLHASNGRFASSSEKAAIQATKPPPFPMSLIESSCRSPRLLSLPIRHTSF